MRQFRLLLFVLCCVTLIGCEDGLKIGDKWLFEPVDTPGATRAEIVHYHLGDEGKTRVDEQKITIELATGYTALSNASGRTIPAQLPAATAEQLREILQGHAWKARRFGPAARDTETSYYELTVYAGDELADRTRYWAIPANRTLPGALQFLSSVFNRADRMAKTLSDRGLNLIQ